MLKQSFQEKSEWHQEEVLLLTLVKDVNQRAQTLLEKDLDAVGHKSKDETGNSLTDSRIK